MIVCSIYCFYNPTGSHRPNVLFNVLWSPRSSVSQPQVQLAAMQFPTIDHPGRDVVFRFGHAMVKFFVRPFTEFCNKIEDKPIGIGGREGRSRLLRGGFVEVAIRSCLYEVVSLLRGFHFFESAFTRLLPRLLEVASSRLP